MPDTLSRHWWTLAIRGVLAIVFGVLAIAWPGLTLVALIVLFGAYAIVNGAVTLLQAARGHTGQSRGWMIVSGVAGLLAGILAFAWPGLTALALLLVIAVWFMATGLFEIGAAIALRRRLEGEWLLVLTGLAELVFGVVLIVWPASGALAIAWLIGILAVVLGVELLVLAFRLRGHRRPAAGRTTAGPSPVV